MTWLKVGQSHGIHTLLTPYTNIQYTSSMVPLISNIPEALEMPRMYQGKTLPPRK